MVNKRLVAIRPYREAIRKRVLVALELVGFDQAQALIIPAGTPDVEVLRLLRAEPAPHGMLCPFNAHRDVNGNQVEGLTTLALVRRELPAFRTVPVMMPVSQIALAGVRLRLASPEHGVMDNIIVVPEPELDDPQAVAARLRVGGM